MISLLIIKMHYLFAPGKKKTVCFNLSQMPFPRDTIRWCLVDPTYQHTSNIFFTWSTDMINLVIIIRIKILNLHFSIFSILNAVVDLSQYILYTVKSKSIIWEFGIMSSFLTKFSWKYFITSKVNKPTKMNM